MSRLYKAPTSWKSPRENYNQWRVWKNNQEIPEYNEKLLGYLPQGAPTSPLISNLVMRECDEKLSEIASKYKLTYTRYGDDLSFSTNDQNIFVESELNRLLLKFTKLYRKVVIDPNTEKQK